MNNLKKQKEEYLIKLLDEFGDFSYKIEDFEITGNETITELEEAALSFHITYMLEDEEPDNFHNDKYDF